MTVTDRTRGATYQRVRDLVYMAGDRGITAAEAAVTDGFQYHAYAETAVRRALRLLAADGYATRMAGAWPVRYRTTELP